MAFYNRDKTIFQESTEIFLNFPWAFSKRWRAFSKSWRTFSENSCMFFMSVNLADIYFKSFRHQHQFLFLFTSSAEEVFLLYSLLFFSLLYYVKRWCWKSVDYDDIVGYGRPTIVRLSHDYRIVVVLLMRSWYVVVALLCCFMVHLKYENMLCESRKRVQEWFSLWVR